MSEDDLLTQVNLLTLTPVTKYQAPELPTFEESKPELLKKVPNRWKNKAIIAVASLSLLSTVSLSGCSRLHHGGAGMAPIYVTYLTEQEVLEIIRLRLEEIGLNVVEPENFDPMIIGINGQIERVGISLFSEENRLGIVVINLGERAGHSGHWNTSIRREAIKTELLNDSVEHIHILFVPDDHFEEVWSLEEHENQLSLAHGRIEGRLLENLEELIDQLREDGMID